MNSTQNKWISIRIVIMGGLFSLLLGVLGARAVALQVFRSSILSQKAANQYEKSFVSYGKRGSIYDRNQVQMAVGIDSKSIGFYPRQVKLKNKSVHALAKALRLNPWALKQKMSSQRSFEWIKRQVTPKEIQAVANLNLDSIDFIPEHSRVYPNKSLAAQVVGFTGVDGHGLEGVEFYYDIYLKGKASEFKVLRDALGRGFDAEKKILSSYSGHNLILTIDRTIQYITEKILAEAVGRYSAKSGIAIVMSPGSGAILAMAHYPRFNPNAYQAFDIERWRNRAITDPFEPGSTMKIFTAAAALESGAITPQSEFFCEKGKYRIGKNTIHDTRPYEHLTLHQIVKYSSNIGAVKVSEQIGPRHLYETLRRFGFGEKTGIDCPGETAGSLMHYRHWSKIDAGAVAFGQAISASAIQLVTAAAAIANDGVLMRPYIVQVVTDQNGRPVKNFKPQKRQRAISIDTARKVKKMMRAVTEKGGTGVRAALAGYTVCGKTGTAQKTDKEGLYAKDKYIASFIGFTPAANPETVILVMLNEPRGEYYGGIVAAPAFRNIAHETLTYLNIPPRADQDKLFARRLEIFKE